MISQPTYPVHPAGDVPGLPAVPASNQHTRRRKPFLANRKRRRQDGSPDASDEEQTGAPSPQAPDRGEEPPDHVDCLA